MNNDQKILDTLTSSHTRDLTPEDKAQALRAFIGNASGNTLVGSDYMHSTGLYFTTAGRRRLASIQGWLLGLAQAGRIDQAFVRARELVGRFAYLNNYGPNNYWGWDESAGTWTLLGDEEPDENDHGFTSVHAVPRYRVLLSDDLTLHGFSVLWGVFVPEEDGERPLQGEGGHVFSHAVIGKTTRDAPFYARRKSFVLSFAFNGGLLYHGPGGGETFAVNIGDADRFWSIHT